ncbi:MAG: sulfite oxidase-like oxidoreductase [Candidatus Bathyarchaeota archaeon]|nr:MAG: sulfite oxidase-like oxidoreductase [Candidatus Bathyarchaeota archaeon]
MRIRLVRSDSTVRVKQVDKPPSVIKHEAIQLRSIFSRKKSKKGNEPRRLPPGQTLTDKFPVLHYGPVPSVDLAKWDFRVFGLVDEEMNWSWEEFQQLPRSSVILDIHCVTRWTKLETEWEGVSVRTLVEKGLIKPRKEARYVIQHCERGFTANLPLDLVLEDNFLLATHHNGEPLTPEHGYPLRGVIGSFPDRNERKTTYLWKGGKWLRALEFRADDRLGFWERMGYHNEADPWKEQRYA